MEEAIQTHAAATVAVVRVTDADALTDALTVVIQDAYVKCASDAWTNHSHFLLYNQLYFFLLPSD
jgi:hypothetical protein